MLESRKNSWLYLTVPIDVSGHTGEVVSSGPDAEFLRVRTSSDENDGPWKARRLANKGPSPARASHVAETRAICGKKKYNSRSERTTAVNKTQLWLWSASIVRDPMDAQSRKLSSMVYHVK